MSLSSLVIAAACRHKVLLKAVSGVSAMPLTTVVAYLLDGRDGYCGSYSDNLRRSFEGAGKRGDDHHEAARERKCDGCTFGTGCSEPVRTGSQSLPLRPSTVDDQAVFRPDWSPELVLNLVCFPG